MKKQNRWFFALMAVVLVASCLSMPVMAEVLLQRDVDKVMSDGEQVASQQPEAKKDARAAQPLVGHKLSQNALKSLESIGRASYFEVFSQQIPDTCKAIESDAYEENGTMVCTLSLMPENWEASTDTLSEQEQMPFYTIQFQDVDTMQGTGEVIGLQRYWLNNANDVIDASYTDAQLAAMEAAARSFAARIGIEPGGLIETDKVAGGYDPGCIFVFDLGDDRTVSVTVAAQGSEITGYSMVRAKG